MHLIKLSPFHLQGQYFLGEEGESCSEATLIKKAFDCENAAKDLNLPYSDYYKTPLNDEHFPKGCVRHGNEDIF